MRRIYERIRIPCCGVITAAAAVVPWRCSLYGRLVCFLFFFHRRENVTFTHTCQIWKEKEGEASRGRRTVPYTRPHTDRHPMLLGVFCLLCPGSPSLLACSFPRVLPATSVPRSLPRSSSRPLIRCLDCLLLAGIIGAGRIGQVHLDTLASVPGVKPVIISDVVEPVLKMVTEKYGVPKYTMEVSILLVGLFIAGLYGPYGYSAEIIT